MLIEAHVGGETEVSRAVGAATLREDLDHAAGSLRAVQRCRCRTLDDLDAIDFVRVEVGQAVFTGTAGEGAAGHAGAPQATASGPLTTPAIHAHAVDVDDGALAEAEAVGTSDTEFTGGAHAAHSPDGPKARNAALHGLAEACDGLGLADSPNVQGCQGHADLAALHSAGGPGDHDLVEVNRGDLKTELGQRRPAAGDGDFLRR